jgi:hypothetical protein
VQVKAASRLLRLEQPRHWRVRRWVALIGLLGCIAVGIALGATVLTTPRPETAAIYACLRGEQVVWWGLESPEQCPRGSEPFVDPEVQIGDPDRSIGHRLTLVLRRWLSIPGVMVALTLASLGWLWAGWKLAGAVSLRWLLVPILLLVAATCVAGPGHWFAKEPFEGPSIISLGTGDAITALDLVGLSLAMFAIALAIRLTSDRWPRQSSSQ